MSTAEMARSAASPGEQYLLVHVGPMTRDELRVLSLEKGCECRRDERLRRGTPHGARVGEAGSIEALVGMDGDQDVLP